MPDNPFPAEERVAVRVGKTPYVRFDRNDYTVPHTHVRKSLLVAASVDRVRILDGTQCIAVHPRCWAMGKQVEDSSHVQELLDSKRRAHEHWGMDLLYQVAERGGNLGFTVAKQLRHLDAFGAIQGRLSRSGDPALPNFAQLTPSPDTARLSAIIDNMAQLVVRNIEEEVVRALKLRAAERGVSAEAEHRALLREALLGKSRAARFRQTLASMPDVGDDQDFLCERDADRSDDLPR